MQTFLVHEDYTRSAEALDPKRRFSQIYEGIHILASLLDMNDQLVNPKRSVKNHPVAKLWAGHEAALWDYCITHFNVWSKNKKDVGNTINLQNLIKLEPRLKGSDITPKAIIQKIPEYRAILSSKDPSYYKGWGESISPSEAKEKSIVIWTLLAANPQWRKVDLPQALIMDEINSCPLCSLYYDEKEEGSFECSPKCPLVIDGKTCVYEGHPYTKWMKNSQYWPNPFPNKTIRKQSAEEILQRIKDWEV